MWIFDPVVGFTKVYEELVAPIIGIERFGRANVSWNSQACYRDDRQNIALCDVRQSMVVEIWKCVTETRWLLLKYGSSRLP